MYSRLLAISMIALAVSCTQYKVVRSLASGQVAVGLAVPGDEREEPQEVEVVIDSVESEASAGPILMNAIRDSETGEIGIVDKGY